MSDNKFSDRQKEVGEKNVPIFAVWNVDKANERELHLLAWHVKRFLLDMQPQKLLFTGRRCAEVACGAERLVEPLLSAWPRSMTLVSGGAEGVDSVAVRLAGKYSQLSLEGQYTKSEFARGLIMGLTEGESGLESIDEEWESRDTYNAERADACIAFLTNGKEGHDGTKATLNIFVAGQYKHDPTCSVWEMDSEGVTFISDDVAFKRYLRLP